MSSPAKVSMGTNLAQIAGRLRGENIEAILARGASGAFVVAAIAQGVALGVQILLARVMGPEQFGIYVYVFTWLNILVLLAVLGLDTTLLRYVASYKVEAAWGALRGILERSDQLTLIASCAVGIIGFVTIWLLRARLGPELSLTFWIGFVILPVFALSTLRQAALRSLKHIILAQLPGSIIRPVLLAVFVGAAYSASYQRVNAPTVMIVNVLATVIALFISVYWLRQKLPQRAKIALPDYRSREWITVALPLLLVNGTFMLLTHADVLLIGALLGTTEAGIYSVASRFATLLLFGLTAASAIAAPMISEFYTQGQLKALQRVVTLTMWAGLGFALPITVAMLIWGRWLLALFGPIFVDAYAVLIILVAVQLVNALTGPTGYVLSMTGHQNQLALILTLSMLISIALSYLLIPILGIVGAAIAVALANSGWNIAGAIFIYRRLSINCSIISLSRIRRMLSPNEVITQ